MNAVFIWKKNGALFNIDWSRYVYHRFSSALKDISVYDLRLSAQRKLTVSDPPIYSQEGDTHV